MATIQWRPEINPLTTPQSYRIRFAPRNAAGIEDIAADIARQHPNFSKADILTILRAEDEAVQARLLNGEQVTKEGSFSWYLSFTGRLESPDEPLPPLDDCLQVNVRVSPPFLAAIRQNAQTERLPMEKKLPLISTAKDTLLELKDVLNPAGALQLNGADLYFDRTQDGSECVIEGTQSGKIVQKRFIKIEASEIILMPELPAQAHPWNNEHTISVTTRYTEHGTLRTGAYERMLRSPLTLTNMGHPHPPETGILTGSAASAYVSVTGGSVSADETLRIQVILDLRADALLFSLLDMKEGGRAGAAMTVTANGELTLQGFADSAVSSLTVRVNNYAGLKEMIRNDYGGRLVDVLDVRTA
ncbi:hypothetical protein [Candidatus Electronema sp. JC]|uniref:hypothetical protein n=1 Tax=Candidatus Electronema sp. JC TaxID=3401570 RepID=UPI003AA89410